FGLVPKLERNVQRGRLGCLELDALANESTKAAHLGFEPVISRVHEEKVILTELVALCSDFYRSIHIDQAQTGVRNRCPRLVYDGTAQGRAGFLRERRKGDKGSRE